MALDAFEQYLADGGDEIDPERQDLVLKEIGRLRNLVGYVHITAPSGAAVSIDGVAYGAAPIHRELPVAASVRHVVKATQNNAVLSEQTIEVTGGRTVTVDLLRSETPSGTSAEKSTSDQTSRSPENLTTPEDSAERKSKSKISKLRLSGIIATSAGAALLIGGAVTGGLSLSKNADLESRCSDTVCPSGTDLSVRNQRDASALATDILIPVGGTAAAVGMILLIVDAVQNKKAQEKSAKWIHPVLAPNMAGLVFEGRF